MSGIDSTVIPEAIAADGPKLASAMYAAKNARKMSRIKREITDNM